MAGRPTKYNDETKRLMTEMASLGLTWEQMAQVLGVTYQTIHNWKKQDSAYFDTIKECKDKADREVVQSLYKRACGYQGWEVKAAYDKDRGEWVTEKVEKLYPPDPTSMIFWLKNRQPKQWRDKVESETTHKFEYDPSKKLSDNELFKAIRDLKE